MPMSVAMVPPRPVVLAPPLGVVSEPSLRVETIGESAAFTALRDEWTELLRLRGVSTVPFEDASSSCDFFLTWEWLHTWWTHLSGGRRLAILTVRRGSELLGIAPFVATASRLGLVRLEFLGTGRAGSDYLDVIVRPGSEQDVILNLASHLARNPAVLDMRQVPLAGSVAMRLACARRRSGGSVQTTRTHVCPFIDLRGHTWESYLGSLGSEHRYNFQRRLRKLDTQHGLRFERVSSEQRRRELLPVLFELHRRRWSERGGSDGLEGNGIAAFHEELSRLALERGWLRLYVLWLGSSPAAALYGFRYGGVFYFYQSGFDPRYRKLSVGLVAMGLAIKSAIEERASTFDLLHGEEAYKLHWAKEVRRLERVRVFPPGIRGHLSRSREVAAEAARGLLHRLRRNDAAPSR
jgi:CelD/BcsL family acetyltransferase involved in cellulose biosynthesis